MQDCLLRNKFARVDIAGLGNDGRRGDTGGRAGLHPLPRGELYHPLGEFRYFSLEMAGRTEMPEKNELRLFHSL